MNKTFNTLQKQGRLGYMIKSTLFSYSVFIVWKTLSNSERKDQAIVDIRDLNNLILLDIYLVSLQLDIIAKLLEYIYLLILNTITFFY